VEFIHETFGWGHNDCRADTDKIGAHVGNFLAGVGLVVIAVPVYLLVTCSPTQRSWGDVSFVLLTRRGLWETHLVRIF
jgi:hypothetical protein